MKNLHKTHRQEIKIRNVEIFFNGKQFIYYSLTQNPLPTVFLIGTDFDDKIK